MGRRAAGATPDRGRRSRPVMVGALRRTRGPRPSALGDRVLTLEHVGSTSVPDLPAKPVIDIDLTVADSSDEAAYVPALEEAGFALRIREPRWHEHRCLVSFAPAANLHVWSPGSPEAIRHHMFHDWLRPPRRPGSVRRRQAPGRRDCRGRGGDGLQPAQAAGSPRDPRPHVPRPRHALTGSGQDACWTPALRASGAGRGRPSS